MSNQITVLSQLFQSFDPNPLTTMIMAHGIDRVRTVLQQYDQVMLNNAYDETGRSLLFDILAEPKLRRDLLTDDLLGKVDQSGLNRVITHGPFTGASILFFICEPRENGYTLLKKHPNLIEIIGEEAFNAPFVGCQTSPMHHSLDQENTEEPRKTQHLWPGYSPLLLLAKSQDARHLFIQHPSLIHKITQTGLNRVSSDGAYQNDGILPKVSALHRLAMTQGATQRHTTASYQPIILIQMAKRAPGLLDKIDPSLFATPNQMVSASSDNVLTPVPSPLQYFLHDEDGVKLLKTNKKLLTHACQSTDINHGKFDNDIPIITSMSFFAYELITENSEIQSMITADGMIYRTKPLDLCQRYQMQKNIPPNYLALIEFCQLTNDKIVLSELLHKGQICISDITDEALNNPCHDFDDNVIFGPPGCRILFYTAHNAGYTLLYQYPELARKINFCEPTTSYVYHVAWNQNAELHAVYIRTTLGLIADLVSPGHGLTYLLCTQSLVEKISEISDPLMRRGIVQHLSSSEFGILLMMKYPCLQDFIDGFLMNQMIEHNGRKQWLLLTLCKSPYGLALLGSNPHLLKLIDAERLAQKTLYIDRATGLSIPINQASPLYELGKVLHPMINIIEMMHRNGVFRHASTEDIQQAGLGRRDDQKLITEVLRNHDNQPCSDPLTLKQIRYMFQSPRHINTLHSYPKLLASLQMDQLTSVVDYQPQIDATQNATRSKRRLLDLLFFTPEGLILLIENSVFASRLDAKYINMTNPKGLTIGQDWCDDMYGTTILFNNPELVNKISQQSWYGDGTPSTAQHSGLVRLTSSNHRLAPLIILQHPYIVKNAPAYIINIDLPRPSPMIELIRSMTGLVCLFNNPDTVSLLSAETLNRDYDNGQSNLLYLCASPNLRYFIDRYPQVIEKFSREGLNRIHRSSNGKISSPILNILLHQTQPLFFLRDHPKILTLITPQGLGKDSNEETYQVILEKLKERESIKIIYGIPESQKLLEMATPLRQKHFALNLGGACDTLNQDPPSEFICPLTGNIMRNPMKIRAGSTPHSFEYEAIFWHLHAVGECPLTRETFRPTENTTADALLVPDDQLRSRIEQWIQKSSQEKQQSKQSDDFDDSGENAQIKTNSFFSDQSRNTSNHPQP